MWKELTNGWKISDQPDDNATTTIGKEVQSHILRELPFLREEEIISMTPSSQGVLIKTKSAQHPRPMLPPLGPTDTRDYVNEIIVIDDEVISIEDAEETTIAPPTTPNVNNDPDPDTRPTQLEPPYTDSGTNKDTLEIETPTQRLETSRNEQLPEPNEKTHKVTTTPNSPQYDPNATSDDIWDTISDWTDADM